MPLQLHGLVAAGSAHRRAVWVELQVASFIQLPNLAQCRHQRLALLQRHGWDAIGKEGGAHLTAVRLQRQQQHSGDRRVKLNAG